MQSSRVITVSAILLMMLQTAVARDVTLPAPVLEWSFYIWLIFAVCVAIGIFIFMRGTNGASDILGSLLVEQNPIRGSPSTALEEALGIVTNRRIRHLPVIEDGKVLGMVSSGDLIHRLMAD